MSLEIGLYTHRPGMTCLHAIGTLHTRRPGTTYLYAIGRRRHESVGMALKQLVNVCCLRGDDFYALWRRVLPRWPAVMKRREYKP
eukprot:COSAG01_NODE_7865_length_3019_cov_6.573288_1_plen_85_part_00